ncbi:MAG: hypothetical protein PHW01_02860 [Patescibacteria group bacterium]|nr:hypothetical protein [Patescibacteria group bacterium]
MQLWRNKADNSLAVSKDVSTGSGDLIVIGEDGEDGTVDIEDWEPIPLEEFMKEIGKLRKGFEAAKNVPSTQFSFRL